MSKLRLVRIVLIVAVGMSMMVGVVHANLKVSNNVYCWDLVADMYTNSHQPLPVDCSYLPFIFPLDFDLDLYPTADDLKIPYLPKTACPGKPNSTSRWAGAFEYGLHHIDKWGTGYAFLSSRDWELIACDRNRDGVFNVTAQSPLINDFKWLPPQDRDIIVDDPGNFDPTPGAFHGWWVISRNVVTPCPQGTCTNELVTTLYVNLDTDCDGVLTDETFEGPSGVSIAEALAHGGLCFYAEGKSPCPPWQIWNGQPQARVTGIGGTRGQKDKTISYYLEPPTTPVEISSFTARWYEDPSRPLIVGAVVAVLAGAVVGALVWRRRPTQL